MSIGVGTLQPKTRIMRPVWLRGLVALVVATALAVAVTNSGEAPRPVATDTTEVSGTLANTPTEMRFAGSAVSGTVANTPSELSGGIAGSFAGPAFTAVPHLPRRTAEAESFGGTIANTPTELSGGMPAPASPYEPIVVNGNVCGQCR